MQQGLDICFDNTTILSYNFSWNFSNMAQIGQHLRDQILIQIFDILGKFGSSIWAYGNVSLWFPHTCTWCGNVFSLHSFAHSKFWSLVRSEAFGKHSISFHFEKYTLLSMSSINHAPKLKSWLNISWEKEEQKHKVHQLFIININIFIFFIFLEQFFLINFVI